MITLTQPNEVTFIGRIWGDEFFWWAETESGYRFVQSGDGWYYYATLSQNGEFATTTYRVGIDIPPAYSYQLERTPARIDEIKQRIEIFNEQIELNRQWYAQKQAEAAANNQPVTLKVGIILIEFQDVKRYKTNPQGNRPDGYLTADFDSMMFSYNYWIDDPGNQKHPEGEEIFGSFRDYWDQMSRGKLRIEGRVANPDNDQDGVPDWLTADSSKGYYAKETTPWDALVNEAIQKAISKNFVDTTNENSTNYFDKLVIVYADKATLTGALRVMGGRGIGSNWIFLAEKSSWQLYWGSDWSFTHIGIYAHEFGHNLGFFDEYYNYHPTNLESLDGMPTDIFNFCLMARGIYNGPHRKGECPATLSAYYRIDKNWVTPIVLTTDSTNFVVEYDYNNPKYYKINPVNANNDEHFILENKKRNGFDLYIPGNPADTIFQAGRLLVWHHMVDYTEFDDFLYDRIAILPADNTLDKETQLTDFFPLQFNPNNQDLNDITVPGAMLGGILNSTEQNIRPAHFALNGIQKLSNGNTIIGEIKLNHAIIKNNIPGNWQLVSVGAIVPNFSAGVVFPTSITPIYRYVQGIGYVVVNNLENGPGYWAKFGSSQSLIHSGFTLEYLSIGISSGWNIIGSISDKVPLANVYTIPPGIISGIFRYENGYVPLTGSDSVKPGVGYWLSSTASGNVILLREAYPSALPKINEFPEINLADLDKFIITDADGYSQTLYVSNIDINTAMVDINLELPPLFTELNFDSRFEYNEFVKRVSADSGTIDLSILVHTNSFPINITWEINPANGISYSFINDSIPGKISNISVIGEKSFSNLDNNKIRLLASVGKTNSSDHLPKEFSLEQNYPNPFNPKTVIGYQLPVTGNVTLKVYDVLGKEVATLVNEYKPAGRYEVEFNASGLSSGVYFYSLQAGSYVETKKLVLLR